jgi:multiple sugar transport system permease protein
MAARKNQVQSLLTWITVLLVFINLVPIGWMVYCSFKDNEEILSGAISPGRRHHDVIFVDSLGQNILVGTQDGGFGVLDQELRVVKHKQFGTFATRFVRQGDTLWVLSSNRGLASYALPGLEDLSKYSAHDMAASLGEKWKTLWVNDVAASSLAFAAGRLYFSYTTPGFPGVVALEPAKGSMQWVSGLETQVTGGLRQMTAINAHTLALLGANGYRRFDAATGTVTKVMPAPSVLTADASRFAELGGAQVAFAAGKRALVYDVAGDTTTCVLDQEAGLGTSVVSALHYQDASPGQSGQLWVGNSQSLHAVKWGEPQGPDSTSGCAVVQSHLARFAGSSMDPGAMDAKDAADEDVTGADITSMQVLSNGALVVGGVKGKVAKLDAQGATVAHADLPKPPIYFKWRNFVDLWRNINFGLYLYNSFIICGTVMVVAMVLASLGGYALARYEFPGKNTFGYSVLATQMIPGIMLLLPIYLMYVQVAKSTGLVVKGTYGGLIITYAAYFVPFSIWILRGFFASIPKELEEAALIDGCGPFRAFFQIILPSAMPGIIATGVYVFLSAWDELMFAWVLTSESTYTIPVGIRLFVGNFQNRYDLMMAAATVSTLPVMLLFFLMQRHIVSGLTAGAVKD